MVAVIIFSSWALYQTACFLVEDMGNVGDQGQRQFNTILFQYLLTFSLITIVIGGIFHFYFTKRMIKPIREMIMATKQMKKGGYPEPIQTESLDEMGMLIEQYNSLIQQLKRNEVHRNELVSNISHEFRTPLANVTGYLNALRNGVITGDKDLYTALVDEANRLTSLMNQFDQLKEWDHAQSQKIFKKETIAIDDLMQQCVSMFELQLSTYNIPYKIQIEPQQLFVQVEGIQQVISNLLENAIRYYEGEEPIVLQGRQTTSKMYEISISGPSPLIPEAERELIFERFYRLDHSRNRRTGGTGLGLAIAKEIVGNHQGKIGLESNQKQNKFWFTLPLKSG